MDKLKIDAAESYALNLKVIERLENNLALEDTLLSDTNIGELCKGSWKMDRQKDFTKELANLKRDYMRKLLSMITESNQLLKEKL